MIHINTRSGLLILKPTFVASNFCKNKIYSNISDQISVSSIPFIAERGFKEKNLSFANKSLTLITGSKVVLLF